MKELDMLHNRIGQLLVDTGPEDAQKILVRATLSPEGDTCEYEYDYIDNEGHEDWFLPDAHTSYDLRLLLVELRKYYVENNLTNDHPTWNGCLLTVDLEKMKINIEFKYED